LVAVVVPAVAVAAHFLQLVAELLVKIHLVVEVVVGALLEVMAEGHLLQL
jgi:hypothetical protein